jgi:hypothetical protein
MESCWPEFTDLFTVLDCAEVEVEVRVTKHQESKLGEVE